MAEVEAAFARYERALVTNDVATLEALFWDDPRTIRYGIGENLYGMDAIRAFRRARSPVGLTRRTRADRDHHLRPRLRHRHRPLFRRDSAPGQIGRQMQSWVRLPEGWRVVAAHVSLIDG